MSINSTFTAFTDKLSAGHLRVETFCKNQLSYIKTLSADKIITAGKTHNFALVLFAAALTGLVVQLATSLIPPYVFIGSFVGVTIHLTKTDIVKQTQNLWESKNYLKLAVSILSLAVGVLCLKKSTLCAVLVAVAIDARSFIPKRSESAPAEPISLPELVVPELTPALEKEPSEPSEAPTPTTVRG